MMDTRSPRLDFRERILQAMREQAMTKAELGRRSGVKYHTLDKFLKGASVKTSGENIQALSQALGIKIDGEAEYDRFRQRYFALDPAQRQLLEDLISGLLGEKS
jgi:transcriptional regulator with XRE-family HTH domain